MLPKLCIKTCFSFEGPIGPQPVVFEWSFKGQYSLERFIIDNLVTFVECEIKEFISKLFSFSFNSNFNLKFKGKKELYILS